MKIITLLAVAAVLLADLFGSKSSVGGPMTDLLIALIVMLAVGLHEAWGRGPVGWIVNVVLAVIGGMIGLSLMSTALEAVMTAMHFEGKLATSHHPLRYIADVAIPVFTVLGSWIAIRIQFEVFGRKTLFLLLVLFAIPADDCSAQTSPPPVDEHALERVPPTVAKRLATRFSLGAFAGRFEETPLDAVREAVGEGTIQHQGDAGGSVYWLCYRRAQHRLWVLSSGEMGGRDHRVTEIVEELTDKDTETSTDCAVIPDKFAPLVFDGKLHLGMSRLAVVTALGPPSKSEAARMVYSHSGKLADGFDETAWLILRFREEKLVSMRGGKTTTN